MEKTIEQLYDRAVLELKNNVKKLPYYPTEVLMEGGMYNGIWLECGPHESLTFRHIEPQVMIDSHEIFFNHQKEDGQFPAAITEGRINWGQIQMVVPIADTALQAALFTNNNAFLERAYECCSKWDHWLEKYRLNGAYYLCKVYCEWDTGHDGSPRISKLPQECPNGDARLMPQIDGIPLYAPDLSATIYGGRVALAKMAELLGRNNECKYWQEQAEKIRTAVIDYCYDSESMWFYDIREDGSFHKIMGDTGLRVLQERLLDQALFDRIFEKVVLDTAKFWTKYPLPSIAADDKAFDGSFPPNYWSGASQALTALRTLRWFDHYNKQKEHAHLMKQWLDALCNSPEFMQQTNPFTGECNTTKQYSPALCVAIEFIRKLYS